MLIDFLESKGICTRAEYEEYIDSIELAGHMSSDYIGFKPDVIIIKTPAKVIATSRKLRLGNHVLAYNGVVLSPGRDEDYYWDGNQLIINFNTSSGDKIVIYWFY